MNKYLRSPIVEFSGDKTLDKEYFETVLIPLLGTVLPGVPFHTSFHSDCHCRTIRLNSYAAAHFFLDFGFSYGPKSHTVHIPTRFYFDQELLFRVIRGVFDADGCVFLDTRPVYARPYPRISFSTVSWTLYSQLVCILEPLFPLYLHEVKNRGAYVLEIYGYKNVEQWMKTIGFSNPRHLHKIQSILPL